MSRNVGTLQDPNQSALGLSCRVPRNHQRQRKGGTVDHHFGASSVDLDFLSAVRLLGAIVCAPSDLG